MTFILDFENPLLYVGISICTFAMLILSKNNKKIPEFALNILAFILVLSVSTSFMLPLCKEAKRQIRQEAEVKRQEQETKQAMKDRRIKSILNSKIEEINNRNKFYDQMIKDFDGVVEIVSMSVDKNYKLCYRINIKQYNLKDFESKDIYSQEGKIPRVGEIWKIERVKDSLLLVEKINGSNNGQRR